MLDQAADGGEQAALAALVDRARSEGVAAGAALVGTAREWLLDPGGRRQGAVYTPPGIAEGVVAEALAGAPFGTPLVVCDPACGGGAFLLAAAKVLHGRGHAPSEIVEHHLWGADTDPLAVFAATEALALWAIETDGVEARPGDGHLVAGDSLLDTELWPAQRFDLVVGNPPFQGQLSTETARVRQRATALRSRFAGPAHGYADTAALFLLAALDLVKPGGRMSFILPESVLGARDAEPVRRALLDRAALVGLWVAAEKVFTASVHVCAPVLEVGGAAGSVRRTRGRDFRPLEPVARDEHRTGWSHLTLAAHGIPEVELSDAGGVLGDLVTATAGFRDQFYGLAPYVVEAAPGHPPAAPALLVTSGLVDAGRCWWGERSTRFAGRRRLRPAVDLAALRSGDPGLARWVDARLVPKVLVATQTKVVEAVADPAGQWVPSVPVISAEPFDPSNVPLVCAALLAPPVTAWALAEAAGTALAAGRVKLAARQVRQVPLPTDREAWTEAAATLADGDWPRFGALMLAAYGLPDDHPVLDWWLARLT